MSYDVWIACKCCESELEPSTNYTYNVSGMLSDVGIDWYRQMNRMPVTDALPILEAAIAKLEADPEKYRAMNPENGWGSYDGLLRWLGVIKDQMHAHPDGMVRAC